MNRAIVVCLLALATLVAALGGCANSIARGKADVFVAKWNRHDVDLVAAAYTEDAELVPPKGKPRRGRAAIEAYHRALFQAVPDAHLELVSLDASSIADGWRTASEWRASGNGKTIAMTTVSLSRQVDGEYKIYKSTWTSPAALADLEGDAPPVAAAPLAPGQCRVDMDCPGEQLCEAKGCVAPR